MEICSGGPADYALTLYLRVYLHPTLQAGFLELDKFRSPAVEIASKSSKGSKFSRLKGSGEGKAPFPPLPPSFVPADRKARIFAYFFDRRVTRSTVGGWVKSQSLFDLKGKNSFFYYIIYTS